MAVAIITGASRGLGAALAEGLVAEGWSVVVDARHPDALESTAGRLRARAATAGGGRVVALAGDVTAQGHRRRLVEEAAALGGLSLLVNNASILGASPLPPLAAYPLDVLRRVLEVNVVAPLALVQAALPLLRQSPDPRILDVTSDAGVEAYPRWGAYGASKAALEHLGAVLAAEEPAVRVWTVDPGDMRTAMHQEAFPGEDISDRPRPEEVVPALVRLVAGDRPGGRLRAADLVAVRP